jgi:hypothetical protein
MFPLLFCENIYLLICLILLQDSGVIGLRTIGLKDSESYQCNHKRVSKAISTYINGVLKAAGVGSFSQIAS